MKKGRGESKIKVMISILAIILIAILMIAIIMYLFFVVNSDYVDLIKEYIEKNILQVPTLEEVKMKILKEYQMQLEMRKKEFDLKGNLENLGGLSLLQLLNVGLF